MERPDYELIIAARSAMDLPPGVLPARSKVVLSHGEDPNTGEKIQNLRAAVQSARQQSEVFAFADSDGRVSRSWLRALVAPLYEEKAGASTGYRWYLPEPPSFWSLVRSVWNAVIAGGFGPGANRFAWGGAMAIRREIFVRAQIAEHWKNHVSDDYALSAAVSRAGLHIVFAPGAMVASVDHTSAGEFLRWARRQLTITKVYAPHLWWPALAAHLVYCAGMAACLAAVVMGHRGAEWVLIALLSPGMLKGANRATLAKAELPEYPTWFRRYGWVHTWWVPLATWIWLFTLASSAFTNVIEWRGNRYKLRRTPVRL
jgi:cellulose synthase/poly-beta-1,6-N-acetylglucosamine synthase-like glycosyltransferase